MKIVQAVMAQIRRLENFVDRPWYPFALAFLTMIDFFVVFIPSDGIIVASVAAKPRKWIVFGVAMAAGSLIGGLLMALLTKHLGQPFIDWLAPGILSSPSWLTTEAWVDRWGFWALFAVAASPLAQQPTILLAAITDMPYFWIGVALGSGRLIKFLGYAWVASHAPKLLSKIPALKHELDELHESPPPAATRSPQKPT
jgi:membrane protein YqaA with SNARE-associated domain